MTEDGLSVVFEALLESAAWRGKYPQLRSLSKELPCRQGIPDYVATTSMIHLPTASRKAVASALTTPACARLLSLLKPVAVRSDAYLCRASGLSARVVSRSLRHLMESNLIEERGESRWVLSPVVASLAYELWAFELKLADWQRALYQALQYRAFADRAVVVVPDEMAGRFERNQERFERFGVGLVAIGGDGNSLREIVAVQKNTPQSRLHRYFALGQFLANAN
jgi:hypothetical protein